MKKKKKRKEGARQYLDRSVSRAGDQQVTSELDGVHGALVALEGQKRFAGGKLPGEDHLVRRARGQHVSLSVLREGGERAPARV
jgi:hypothetical protein